MEEWKALPGTDGVFVSSDGYVKYSDGSYIKQRVGNAGYSVFTVSGNRRAAGKVGMYTTHRVVAENFVDGRDLLRCYVDHINGDKLDNRACNLKWVTLSENMKSFWGAKPNTGRIENAQCVLGF